MSNSYAESAYADFAKTHLSFTKVTLVFCFGLRQILCSFDLDFYQSEQKVLRVKFLFVLFCLISQARVCRLKRKEPQLGLDSSYCWGCVGMWQTLFSIAKFSVYYVYKYSLLFTLIKTRVNSNTSHLSPSLFYLLLLNSPTWYSEVNPRPQIINAYLDFCNNYKTRMSSLIVYNCTALWLLFLWFTMCCLRLTCKIFHTSCNYMVWSWSGECCHEY